MKLINLFDILKGPNNFFSIIIYLPNHYKMLTDLGMYK